MQGVSRKFGQISFLWFFVALLLASCHQNQSNTQPEYASDNIFRYARNVVAYPTDYGYYMEVLNPWDPSHSLGAFALVQDTVDAKQVKVADAIKVTVPVQRVISFSSTQWSVFFQLNEVDRVKGILEGNNIHSPEMKQLLSQGVVKDVGTEASKNIELMIKLHPDIILYSPYFDGNQDPLKVTGAVLFPFADYLETTPLGRAEWIRVIGILCGCQEKTDAWFNDIERRYNELTTLCADVKQRPTVFSDLAFNGQWYVAGGKSYIAQLFEDAGADYIWKNDNSTASFPLDPETILAKAKHADFWRVANSSSYPMTYASLKQENSMYSLFDAFKNRKIIVCDIQDTGYFETSQIEPDRLLGDFIYFFHPEVLVGEYADYQPRYYHLMQ